MISFPADSRISLVADVMNMRFSFNELAAKLQKTLHEKTAHKLHDTEEHLGALQGEMAKVLGEQHDPALPPT
ncbi:hypothetical protein HA45_12755 [Pantoea rodasii]|nr:hypothetical protein HA45_12755 [Pantoea rodasii]